MASMPRVGILAGPPTRISTRFESSNATTHGGIVKLRLGHSRNGSVLVPEQLFIEADDGWRFYQATFFGPPIFGFNVEPKLHVVRFNVDVGEPRAQAVTRVIVTVRSDELVRKFDDGAQLYRCDVEAPPGLLAQSTGSVDLLPDGDFALHLFHVTNDEAAESIRASGEIRSSSWNLQGTRKLKNVGYSYFTSLHQIRDKADLQRIGMSSDGKFGLQTTSFRPLERVLVLEVYRENTAGRTRSLDVAVPSRLLAPPHLLLHRTGMEAYYEVVGPEIYRVGLLPSSSLPYVDGNVVPDDALLKRFTYIVAGDAAEIDGLAAPYDEEDTEQVMHLELLEGTDPFEFWLQHANSDQMTGREFEPRELE
jgi:hypothetical protein